MGLFDGAAGDIISGGASLVGGLITNAQNRREAERNRSFQAMMSNTAHQREVEDLKKAGLNPLLSGTGGAGSSTPTGGQAVVENSIGSAVSSAISGARLKKEIEQAQANIDLTNAQKDKVNMESTLLGKEIPRATWSETLWNNVNNFGQKVMSTVRDAEKIRNEGVRVRGNQGPYIREGDYGKPQKQKVFIPTPR